MAIDMLPKPTEQKVSNDSIRLLTPEEIKSVEHIFTAQGASLPNPSVSVFIGAVKDGKVLGFLVLQLKLHAEPMYIEDGHSDLFLPLVSAAESHILKTTGPQWVYLFAPAGKVAQLATKIGMQVEPWVVLSKLVYPEMPTKSPVELQPILQENLPLEDERIQ